MGETESARSKRGFATICVGVALMLVGTNIVTYAATRYLTGQRIIDVCHDRWSDYGREVAEHTANDRRQGELFQRVRVGMEEAVGVKRWHRPALLWMAAGLVLTVAGILFVFVGPGSNRAGMQAGGKQS